MYDSWNYPDGTDLRMLEPSYEVDLKDKAKELAELLRAEFNDDDVWAEERDVVDVLDYYFGEDAKYYLSEFLEDVNDRLEELRYPNEENAA